VGLGVSLLPVLTALVASAALYVDYRGQAPVFCQEGGGCDALRHTAIASPLGVPLPLLGLVGFLALGVVTLLAGGRARIAQLVLSVGAALVGIVLLLAQVHFHALCPFCVVADSSAIACAVAAAARLRLGLHEWPPWPAFVAGAAGLLAAVLVPLVAGASIRAGTLATPQVIRDEMAATPRGEVTLVDFVDFECPFCRMTHAELQPLVREHPGKVRLVRRQVPLASHSHAHDAARAACCGEQLGEGDTMADALFTAPVEDLTPEGCERIAQKIGLSLPAYRACVANPATDVRIETDRAEFKAAGGFALPTLWIDDGQLVGAQTRESLATAIGHALAHAGS
jgi:protein-disulfide isomerase